jgi:phenylalanyl-tRNA synthetase beta chain
MKLGLFTEAATRFKHDLDPKQCIPGLRKATEIIKKTANGQVASEIVDIHYQKHKTKTIQIDPKHVALVLGVIVSTEKISSILQNLEYVVEKKRVKGKFLKTTKEKSQEYLYVTPPFWRKDISIKEDVYEDIGRIYGFNNIKIELPRKEIVPPESNQIVEIKKKIRDILSNSGANEMITYSFTDSSSFEDCNLDNNLAYRIKNALSPELSLMRTCILQSLLSKSKENIQRGKERFVTYEMNIAHLNNYAHKDKLPIEHWYLGLLLTDAQIDTSTSPFYSAKKYLEKIFNTLGIYNAQYELVADREEIDLAPYLKNILAMFEPNASAIINIGGISLGVVGEIRKDVQKNHKLPSYTAGIELNLDELAKIKPESKKYYDKPKYPTFTQDLCFEVPIDLKYSELENKIVQILEKKKLWNKIEALDIYQESEDIDKKRSTYRITASDYNKTLTDKNIRDITNNITNTIIEKYDAVLV